MICQPIRMCLKEVFTFFLLIMDRIFFQNPLNVCEISQKLSVNSKVFLATLSRDSKLFPSMGIWSNILFPIVFANSRGRSLNPQPPSPTTTTTKLLDQFLVQHEAKILYEGFKRLRNPPHSLQYLSLSLMEGGTKNSILNPIPCGEGNEKLNI